MGIPENLKYDDTHEWVRIEGNKAYVGITEHAQHELGDIVFVELPEIGTVVKKGEEATNIESVKAAASIYAPLSGKVIGVNEDLNEHPEKINTEPYDAFIFELEISDTSETESLLDAAAYSRLVQD
ncbi:MAG: glycine cleavage system protein GcvH [Spirochaetales bacterium]|nr:glycine cleavage system protein GcvH [Spirochaetales bacterium]